MKNILRSTIFCLILATLQGCLKYDDLRENPNDAVAVSPSLLFSSVIPRPSSSFSGIYRNSQYHNDIAADLGVSSPVNYRYGSADFSYKTLKDIDKMVKEAEVTQSAQYAIIAKFLKAIYFIDMSRRMGDIPLSQALKGADEPLPVYDSQKSVYIQCLNWLDEANLELGQFIQQNATGTINGDIYYNGNLSLWQKAINAYTLRVLVSLSKKANLSDVNVQGRFANLVNNPDKYPLMTGIVDNMQFDHKDEDSFRGAYNPNEQIVVEGVIYADTYIELLKANQDPRIFKVAEPTRQAMEADPGNEEAVRLDFDSYAGSDISLNQEENSTIKTAGGFSIPKEDRFLNFVGQPSIFISYWEQELNIAEAIHRGWVSGNAKEHYNNGVAGSMEFYEVAQGDIIDYLNNKVPYVTGDAGLKRIHQQMYLAFAENSGWEGWFHQQRTGVPSFKFSDINQVDKLPLRWAYPTSEDTDNQENYRAALRSQFGSEVDDRNQVMWLLKD